MFSFLWQIALVHTFGMISPGPDFILISRFALSKTRLEAILASLGLSLGVLIHVSLVFLGTQQLILKFPLANTLLTLFSTCYLSYIGIQCLVSFFKYKKENLEEQLNKQQALTILDKNTFLQGLITNLTNPKAIIFFTSIIAPFTNAGLDFIWKIVIVLELFSITLLWFFAISFLFSHQKAQLFFQNKKHWLDCISGFFFLFFSLAIFVYHFFLK